MTLRKRSIRLQRHHQLFSNPVYAEHRSEASSRLPIRVELIRKIVDHEIAAEITSLGVPTSTARLVQQEIIIRFVIQRHHHQAGECPFRYLAKLMLLPG